MADLGRLTFVFYMTRGCGGQGKGKVSREKKSGALDDVDVVFERGTAVVSLRI